MKKILTSIILSSITLIADNIDGENLFKEYCWGCHHQTAEAFGPSFRTIASKRNRGQIIAQIVDPKGTYKSLGYKRNSMPSFGELSSKELEALADFIMKFKEKK